MSFVTGIMFFVSSLLLLLTYIIATTEHVPGWLAWITCTLMIVMLILAFISWVDDMKDKLEDFTDGR